METENREHSHAKDIEKNGHFATGVEKVFRLKGAGAVETAARSKKAVPD